MRNYKLTDFAD